MVISTADILLLILLGVIIGFTLAAMVQILLGVIIGFTLAAMVQSSIERDAEKHRVWTRKGKAYWLTPIDGPKP